MKPISMPSTLASTMLPNCASEMSHVASRPVIAEPTRLPTAPTARARNIATTPTSSVETTFADITRPRHGTSVYVVRPVRWLYSPVTDRIAMIGSTTESGIPIAVEKVFWVIASSGAQMITAAVARTDTMPTLAISQKPARVSNILRSSTPTRRVIGMGRTTRRAADATGADVVVTAGTGVAARVAGGVWVVMLLLLHERSRR